MTAFTFLRMPPHFTATTLCPFILEKGRKNGDQTAARAARPSNNRNSDKAKNSQENMPASGRWSAVIGSLVTGSGKYGKG